MNVNGIEPTGSKVTKRCKKCGWLLIEVYTYCPNCGQKI